MAIADEAKKTLTSEQKLQRDYRVFSQQRDEAIKQVRILEDKRAALLPLSPGLDKKLRQIEMEGRRWTVTDSGGIRYEGNIGFFSPTDFPVMRALYELDKELAGAKKLLTQWETALVHIAVKAKMEGIALPLEQQEKRPAASIEPKQESEKPSPAVCFNHEDNRVEGEERPDNEHRRRRASLRKEPGDYWLIVYGPDHARLKDVKGLTYLAYLLQNPYTEIKAHALAAHLEVPEGRDYAKSENESLPSPDAGREPAELEKEPMRDVDEDLDETARKQLRDRLVELASERGKADADKDFARITMIDKETADIRERLNSTKGSFGRARKFTTSDERARKAVTKAIKEAIDKIRTQLPALGRELDNIRTGDTCSYHPDPSNPLDWTVILPSRKR
jgi:hypothetical protein